jgi:hypothetical protein
MMSDKHQQPQEVVDRRGRKWTITRIAADQADDEDFRFWFDEMTPDERVMAVYEALESSLQAQGQDGVPRFRRVHRRVQRPWG